MADGDDEGLSPVVLHVYDLSQGLARQLSAAFLGTSIDAIYHTGVVVYGKEYWFGNGIEHGVPGRTYFGPPLRKINLGDTSVPQKLLDDYLRGISEKFSPATYSLLHNNCNHFSDELAEFLVGTGIPKEIVDLPKSVLNSPQGPLLASMLQGMENSLRNGQAPGFHPSASLSGAGIGSLGQTAQQQSGAGTRASQGGKVPSREEEAQLAGDRIPKGLAGAANPPLAGESRAVATVVPVPQSAKQWLEEEIRKEFTMLMTIGNMKANEAAAEALRRVNARRGQGSTLA